MEEIKVGEYIRTNNGEIGKLTQIEFDEIDKNLKWYFYDDKKHYKRCVNKPNIVNHSFNKIELIEKGDYINGKCIEEIVELQGQICLFYDLEMPMQCGLRFFTEKDIKTIVTKQRFEDVQYTVKEELWEKLSLEESIKIHTETNG